MPPEDTSNTPSFLKEFKKLEAGEGLVKRIEKAFAMVNVQLAKMAQQETKINEAMGEQEGYLKKREKLLATQRENHKSILETLMEEEEVAKQRIMAEEKALSDKLTALFAEQTAAEELYTTKQKSKQITEEDLKERLRVVASKKEEVKELYRQLGAQRELLNLTKEEKDALVEVVSQREKANKLLQGELNSAGKFVGMMGSFVGIGKSFHDTMIGGAVSMISSVGTLALDTKKWFDSFPEGESKVKAVGTALAGAGKKALDMVGGLVATRTQEYLVALDRLTATVFRNTGATDEMAASVIRSSNALRAQGLDIKNAGPAFEGLLNNTVMFRTASASARESMVEFTATMAQAGVSVADTTEIMNTLNIVMGQTGEQAEDTIADLTGYFQGLNISVTKGMQDFKAASSVIAVYGDKMTDEFKALEAQAAATGLSMGSLLGLAAQFDTFASAADAVGRLNGILGGPYLNSLDMVYKTESERNRAVLESVANAGIQFDQLSRYEQKSLAASVGISNMSEAAAFFGQSLGGFDAAQEKAEANKKAQEDMAEMAKKATTMFENLQNAVISLAVSMSPLIEAFRAVIDFLAAEPWVGMAILSLAIGVKLVLAFGAWQTATASQNVQLGILNALQAKTATGAGGTAVAMGAQAGATGVATAATGALTTSFIGFNIATGGIILAVGGLVYVLMKLIGQFTRDDVGSTFMDVIGKTFPAALNAVKSAALAIISPLSFVADVVGSIIGKFKDTSVGSTLMDVIGDKMPKALSSIAEQANAAAPKLKIVGDVSYEAGKGMADVEMASGGAGAPGEDGAPGGVHKLLATSTKIESSHVERVRQIVQAANEYSAASAGAGAFTGMGDLLQAVTGLSDATTTAATTSNKRPVIIHVEGNMLRGFIEGYDAKADKEMKWGVS